MPPVIFAREVAKHYGDFVAVDALDFEVFSGECFGVLGPNGAGKTTTMRMVGCVSPLSAGSLEVFGKDVGLHPRQIKARLGVVPQEDCLDDDLSVIDNLIVHAGFFGMHRRAARARAQELLEWMSLGDRAENKVRVLSGGMRRRLVIARALVNEPDLILLDEPTTGLDPQARHHIWERLRSLRDAGVTLLLTTHYMEEAANLCDRLVIMDRAKMVLQGVPARLVREHLPSHVVEVPKRVLNSASLDGVGEVVRELSDRYHKD